jgi:hypothetical protein
VGVQKAGLPMSKKPQPTTPTRQPDDPHARVKAFDVIGLHARSLFDLDAILRRRCDKSVRDDYLTD